MLSGSIRLWQVVVLALAFGTLSAAYNPARQAFVAEVVGRDLIRNAVTLNSTTVNVARVIGPTIAAVLAGTVGLGWCFVVNAVSFGFVVASLLSLHADGLHPAPPLPRGRGQLRAGLRYAERVPAIIRPLLMMALVGTFTFEFEVSLPLLARTTFGGGDSTYSWLIGAMSAGAVAGGLYAARSAEPGWRGSLRPRSRTRSLLASSRSLPPCQPRSPHASWSAWLPGYAGTAATSCRCASPVPEGSSVP